MAADIVVKLLELHKIISHFGTFALKVYAQVF